MQTNSKNQQEKILKYNEFAHFFFPKGKSLHLPLATKLHLNVTNACKNVTLRKKEGNARKMQIILSATSKHTLFGASLSAGLSVAQALPQPKHPFENQTFETTLHVVWEERGIDKVKPFGKGTTELLCHILYNLLIQSGERHGFLKIAPSQFSLSAIQREGKLFGVFWKNEEGRQ